MIKLNRSEKPAVLIENEKDWTNQLQEAISKYGSYSVIPKEEKVKLISHYRHSDIKSVLFSTSNEKCAFCEAKPGDSGNIEVEHYFPKSMYPEFAFKWENFLPACRKCNLSKDDHDTRSLPIVNPYELDPENVFVYEDIRISVIDNDHKNIGLMTISVCGLNSARLMKSRGEVLVVLHEFNDALEGLIDDYKTADSDVKRKNKIRKIRESVEAIEILAEPSERYSSYCKFYLKNSANYQQALSILEYSDR